MKFLIFYLILIFIISPIASQYDEPNTTVDTVLEADPSPEAHLTGHLMGLPH